MTRLRRSICTTAPVAFAARMMRSISEGGRAIGLFSRPVFLQEFLKGF